MNETDGMSDAERMDALRAAYLSRKGRRISLFARMTTFLGGFALSLGAALIFSAATRQDVSTEGIPPGLILLNSRNIHDVDGNVVGPNPHYCEVVVDHEERFQARMAASVSLALGELILPFESVKGRLAELTKSDGSRFLRFRIHLVGDRYVDAVIVPWCERILYAAASYPVGVPVNEILCFRATPVAESMLTRRDEFLSENEARILFHEVFGVARRTEFDWNDFFSHLPFGVWNRYHPIKSGMFFLLIGAAVFLLKWIPAKAEERRRQKKEDAEINRRQASV